MPLGVSEKNENSVDEMCCIIDQIHNLVPSKIFINDTIQPERTVNPSESEITTGHESTVAPGSTIDLPKHGDPEYTVENSTDPSITETKYCWVRIN